MAGIPVRSAYCAAKHGLIGYHDAVRAENEHLGVKILVVAPGSVRTDISRNALNADGSVRGESDKAIANGLTPEVAAARILDDVAAGARAQIGSATCRDRVSQYVEDSVVAVTAKKKTTQIKPK